MTNEPIPPPITLEAWSNLLAGQVLGFFDGDSNQLTQKQAELLTYAIKQNVADLWPIRPPELHA